MSLGALGDLAQESADLLIEILNEDSKGQRYGHTQEGKNRELRQQAAEALGAMPSTAHLSLSSLIGWLGNTDYDLSNACASSLGNLGPIASTACPHMLSILQTKNSLYFETTIEALVKINQDQALEGLLILLRRKDDRQGSGYARRQIALRCIERHRLANAEIVEELIQWMNNPNEDSRFSPAGTLGKLGEHAAPAVPHLRRMIETGDEYAEVAKEALQNLGLRVR